MHHQAPLSRRGPSSLALLQCGSAHTCLEASLLCSWSCCVSIKQSTG
jgi:hypothetical protein